VLDIQIRPVVDEDRQDVRDIDLFDVLLFACRLVLFGDVLCERSFSSFNFAVSAFSGYCLPASRMSQVAAWVMVPALSRRAGRSQRRALLLLRGIAFASPLSR